MRLERKQHKLMFRRPIPAPAIAAKDAPERLRGFAGARPQFRAERLVDDVLIFVARFDSELHFFLVPSAGHFPLRENRYIFIYLPASSEKVKYLK